MSKFKLFLFLLVALGLTYVGLSAFRAGPPPEIFIEPGMPAIGKATPIKVIVGETVRGLSRVKVDLVQGEATQTLEERTYTPREPHAFWGERTTEDVIEVVVGRETSEWLKEGKATLRVTADRAGAWLRNPDPEIGEAVLPVKLRPPTLQVASAPNYVDQGGTGVVTYVVGEDSIRDGVVSGGVFFPGHPLPNGGSPQQRFALYGANYDDENGSQIRLIAEDQVGNVAELRFVDHYNTRPLKRDQITLSDNFMKRVVPAILAQSPEVQDKGDLLGNYLMINNDLRRINNETIAALSQKTAGEFLWRGRFLAMRNSQRMSNFAERRTYTYNGQAVDQQDHVGFDLASVRRDEIQAANRGNVVLARNLGIYGNTVVLDHGFGLQTLYSHLSQIGVEEGQAVERGESVGRSGQTGLAGGDHLHFGVYLSGMPVNPAEWFDGNWIQNRVTTVLGGALPDPSG